MIRRWWPLFLVVAYVAGIGLQEGVTPSGAPLGALLSGTAAVTFMLVVLRRVALALVTRAAASFARSTFKGGGR